MHKMNTLKADIGT